MSLNHAVRHAPAPKNESTFFKPIHPISFLPRAPQQFFPKNLHFAHFLSFFAFSRKIPSGKFIQLHKERLTHQQYFPFCTKFKRILQNKSCSIIRADTIKPKGLPSQRQQYQSKHDHRKNGESAIAHASFKFILHPYENSILIIIIFNGKISLPHHSERLHLS